MVISITKDQARILLQVIEYGYNEDYPKSDPYHVKLDRLKTKINQQIEKEEPRVIKNIVFKSSIE